VSRGFGYPGHISVCLSFSRGRFTILLIIALFSLAALAGLYLVFIGVRQHRGSLLIGLGHGGVATLALTLLVIDIIRDPVNHLLYNSATFLFALALTGGLFLLALREGKKPPPMVVVGLHAAIALIALALLLKGYLHS